MISSCVRYSTLFFQRSDVTCELSTRSYVDVCPLEIGYSKQLISRADNIIPATIWTIIEADVTIISACLIVSRPWLVKLYPSKMINLMTGWFSRQSRQRSSGRKGLFSSLGRLTRTPPAVDASMGTTFEFDVKKIIEIGHVNDERYERRR